MVGRESIKVSKAYIMVVKLSYINFKKIKEIWIYSDEVNIHYFVFSATSFVLGIFLSCFDYISTPFSNHVITWLLHAFICHFLTLRHWPLYIGSGEYLDSLSPFSRFSDLHVRKKVIPLQLTDAMRFEAQELLAIILLLNKRKKNSTHSHGRAETEAETENPWFWLFFRSIYLYF